jgi:ADP-heptose:LPS heptosyltransferase
MIIGLPSGIGDISWVVSKLINSAEWKNGLKMQIADGWPFRAQEYLESAGAKLADPPYGNFRYEDIITWESVHPYKLWEHIPKNIDRFLMQPNWHLEQGKSLKDWLPDLPTSYHYKLDLPSVENKGYCSTLKNGNYIGISAASYRGHKAWKTWGMSEWKELCNKIVESGYSIVLLGGAWDDLTQSLENEFANGGGVCLNLVGKTTFPEACSIHKLLKFYIGFSSGLGIIRSVMGLPTIMLWPEHQQPLSYSWADPEDIKSKNYMPSSYMEVRGVFNLFKIQEEAWRRV